MKIIKIIEETKSISSNIKNAYIDFSKMTISVVAVCSNVVKNGKPLIGYGFNSNGRYGQGHLIRERFAPRLLEANTNEILNDEKLRNELGKNARDFIVKNFNLENQTKALIDVYNDIS